MNKYEIFCRDKDGNTFFSECLAERDCDMEALYSDYTIEKVRVAGQYNIKADAQILFIVQVKMLGRK